ncbi:CmcJ/NvfI family oxidoreductase [uncultured Roseibium sp.]|uniref:CmcJ/NvfI family oxidoreductase n=1 Tax=uncultured Roseibium sp. TaxID=1936171 RepID=UPI002610994C|nr:CmcJ/NvfI family oxidoreductase [uncultured Roseibium sp.]
MHVEASVNYHVTAPGRQAFHIDAGGVEGKFVSPVLVPTSVSVLDLRDGQTTVDFQNDSVVFVDNPSSVVDFGADGGWKPEYDLHLTELLKEQIGAEDVLVFDHTVRVDDPASGRKPARNVHSDYSETGARQRLVDLVGETEAEVWDEGHFGFVNVWRPVKAPIMSAPLGFVRPRSVAKEDWVLLDLIYPDRTGQIMGLVNAAGHEWVYLSRMRPDEVAIFNIFDNKGLASIAHSALDRVENGGLGSVRMSIESRTLVRYADRDT